jgi:hypothetical protein
VDSAVGCGIAAYAGELRLCVSMPAAKQQGPCRIADHPSVYRALTIIPFIAVQNAADTVLVVLQLRASPADDSVSRDRPAGTVKAAISKWDAVFVDSRNTKHIGSWLVRS